MISKALRLALKVRMENHILLRPPFQASKTKQAVSILAFDTHYHHRAWILKAESPTSPPPENIRAVNAVSLLTGLKLAG